MATYGNYEAVREIHRSGLASLWAARPATGGDAVYCVKLCEPDPDIAGVEAAEQAIAAFLNQAKVQKEAAAAGAHWAPIHESGVHASGAYLVTDLFPRSLERLALSRVRIDAAVLRAITRGIVAGLRELERATTRVHGNLKASNVLLGPGELMEARLALCDPLPSRAARALKPGADGRALADLIHLLVTHQPLRGAFPVVATAEWAALGRTKDAWLGLCNRLLDPHPEGGPASLEEIESVLAGREFTPPRRRLSTPVLAAGAAGVLLIAGGGGYLLLSSGGQTAAIIPELGIAWEPDGRLNWETLCDAYIGRFYDFIEGLDKPGDPGPGATRRELYLASEPSLAATFELLDAARKDKMDSPGRIIGRSSADPVSLRSSQPEKAQTGQGMAQTGRLLSVVRGFEAALGEEWAPRKGLAEFGAALEARGWTAAGQKAREAAKGGASEGWRDRASQLDRVLAGAALAQGTRERLDRLDARATAFAAENDPILAMFGALVAGAGTVPAEKEPLAVLRDLDAAVRQTEDIGNRIGEAVNGAWQRVDRAFFVAESPVYRSREGRPPKELLEAWLAEVGERRYAQLDPAADPVASWNVDQRLSDVDARINSLAEEQAAEPEEELAGALRTFVERAAGLRADAEGVRAIIWNRANEARKIADAGRVRSASDAFHDELNTYIGVRNRAKVANADEARQRLNDDPGPASDSSAISQTWDRWRDELVAQIGGTNYKTVSKRAGEVRDVLGRVNEAVPLAPEPLDAARDWNRALADAARRERETRLTGVLSGHSRAPDAATAAQIEGAAERTGQEYGGWAASVRELTGTLNGIEDLLMLGYGPREGVVPEGPTIAERYGPAAGSALLSRPDIAEACRPITSRIEALQRISADDNLESLATVITQTSPQPGEIIAAWRRLDALRAWPASGADLTRESGFRDRVAAVIGRIGDPARQGVLRAELAATSRTRWERALAAASSAAEIEAVAGMMEGFGASAATVADPRLRYNVLVYDLKRSVASSPGAGARPDEEVRARATQFVADVVPIAGTVGADARAGALIAEVRAIAEGAEPPAPDIRRLGPGSVAGWTGELTGNGHERVRFTGPGGLQMEFVLLDKPGQLPAPAFIATTEVPAGVLLTVASTPPGRSALDSLLPSADTIRGPAVWVRSGAGLALNATWLDALAARNIGNYNEPDLAIVVRAVTDTGRPTALHPVQQVSASAAIYVARLLGCRLPTPAEWKAALDSNTGPHARNLRDQSWSQRQARVREFDDALVNDVRKGSWMPWPDRGVFVPKGVAAPPGGRDAEASGEDDGEPWFTAVGGSGPGPYHLIGNVAELVLDAAAETDSSPAEPEAVRALVETHASRIQVVGGSALSAPELPREQPLDADDLDMEDQIGYADVGFRLAFSAAGLRKSFAARLGEALTENPYLGAR